MMPERKAGLEMRDRIGLGHRLLGAVRRTVMGTITHVSTQEALVGLTFDDGPHPDSTPILLDILGRYQARATFFMIGQVAQRYPALVQQVAQAGHAIGNHSWDHTSFPLLASRQRRAQIRACQKAIAPYGKRLFRPPYGHQSRESRLDALWLGYQVVTWNVVVYDWLDHDTGWIADRLASEIQPGSVILLHDALYSAIEEGYADRRPMLQALDAFLDQFSGRFRFVTIPQLLRQGHPQRTIWNMEPNSVWLNDMKVLVA